MKRDIKEIISGIDSLRPFPQVAHKVMKAAADPDISMSYITGLIQYDPALTANCLKACNSAFFGLSKKVDSLHQAVVYLGLDKVVNLVLLGAGSGALSKTQEGYGLGGGELWRCSVSSALISEDLAERMGLGDVHAVFTAALLKDIGKVVLSQHVGESFEKINLLVSGHGYSFREAEKEVLGIDHAELGALIAERWRFSSKMVDIIRHHHTPIEASHQTEASIVHLADTLCMMMGIGVGSDGLAYRFHQGVLQRLGLTDLEVQGLMAGFCERLSEVEELLGMALGRESEG